MSRRAPIDILRSLSRHVYEVLAEPWSVALPEAEGVFDRPFASVWPAGEAIVSKRGPHMVDMLQVYAIHLYPTVGENEEQSLLYAGEAESALHDGFMLGLAGSGHPARMPLWDYEGVSMDESATPRPIPPGPSIRRARSGEFAWVRDFTSRPMQDESAAQLHFIAAQVRLAWTRKTAQLPTEPLVDAVNIGFDVTP